MTLLTKRCVWVMALLSAVILLYGLYLALLASPPDHEQKELVRYIYIHVPCSWLGLSLYFLLGVVSCVSFVYRMALLDAIAYALACTGGFFTTLSLISGSLWAMQTWGHWLVLDARVCSMYILWLLYLGVIVLRNSFDDISRGISAARIIAILGLVNVPIVRFSVRWWNTIHQGPSVTMKSIYIAPEIMYPLMVNFMGLLLYAIAVILLCIDKTRTNDSLSRY